MSATKLLSQLSQQGVQFWSEGDNLRYRAPKGVLTPDARDQLIKLKAEILDLITTSESEALPQLTKNPEQGHVPFGLTDLQQAYAIGCSDFFELGNVSAHYYVEVEINELDIARLQLAFKQLIQRHEALRTRILPDGQQQILETIPDYSIAIVDLRGKDADFVNSYLENVRERFAHTGPSIDAWPLFETVVHRIDDTKFLLHLSISLIVCDALSSGIFFRELSALYQDPTIYLKPLDVSYRDYTLALKQLKQSQAYQQSQQYWWNRLSTFPQAPELPLFKQPSTLEYPRFRRWSQRLEPEQWQQFKLKATQFGLKPASTLCSAYAAVLNAWSKNSHFAINVLYFNRAPLHPEAYQIIGNFSSTILLEVDCGQSTSFITQAQTLQKQLWKDLENSLVSGVEVLGELNRRQGGNSRAAMPVTFASALGLDARTSDLEINLGTLKQSGLQTPFVLLDHQVLEEQGALVLNWDAVDEVFPPGMMQDMFDAYCQLLHRLASDETAWETLPNLVPSYQLQQQEVVNATQSPISEATLHSLFVAQAALRPLQTAVIDSRRRLTYAELDKYTNRVARYLRQAGTSVNSLVAVVMEKGWEQVVGVLGILKAGGAYLPIDPSLPKDRLWYLLENSNVELVLTQSWLDEIVWPPQVQRLCLDQIDDDDRFNLDSNYLPSIQTSQDIAYVIYTSGSTGLPKGVTIDHRGAVNTILDINKRFNVTADDRIFAISSLSFDLSVYDIFGALAAGSTIVLPDASAIRDPKHWLEVIEREQVTVWNSAPPLMKLLVESETLPSTLKLILLSGDWIPLSLPEQIKAQRADVKIISLGGATEASIWSIFYPIETLKPHWSSIPYGRPLSNQTFYVLDEKLEPCPTWVTGHLYIGGIGLARGYWQDEKKTAASFIKHHRTGERLYRTGDLGRSKPNGDIEFLGREDFQVKIRGYRIELGEIEAALTQHPEIKAVVVTAIEDSKSEKQLVAYIVANSAIPISQIRQFLQQKLPEYMIPSVFIPLDSLPITSNGKLDRKALPQPQQNNCNHTVNFVAPCDIIEMKLVQIWKEVLNIKEHVSVTDNFFDLGGNSISAVRLMSQIQKRFGDVLPLSTLFQQGTIQLLAQQLRQQQPIRPWSPLVEIQPQGNTTPFFCIHPVGGNVLCYTELAQKLGIDQPFYGLQAPGLNADSEFIGSIEEMATYYIEAIRTFQPNGPYLIGGWSFGGVVAFEIAQQLQNIGQQVALLAIIDAEVPDPDQVLDSALLAAWFIQDLSGSFEQDISQLRYELQALNSEEQLNYILAQVRKLNLMPIDAVSLQHFFEVFKANMRAMYKYRPKVYPNNIILLKAQQQREKAPTNDLGWGKFASGGIKVHTILGNHYTIFRDTNLDLLSTHLKACLIEAQLTHSLKQK